MDALVDSDRTVEIPKDVQEIDKSLKDMSFSSKNQMQILQEIIIIHTDETS